jgi:hypothetical protein
VILASRERRVTACAVLSLLAAGLAIQVWFLRHYPQPILFGDAAGYYSVGKRVQRAVVMAGTAPRQAFEAIRPYLYFSGVGVAYAAIDRVRPGDLATFRLVLAGFNTLGLLGLFVLARALTGSRGAGFLALGAGVLYPSLSVQTGRLLPDPITGALIVWSAALFVLGVRSVRATFFAGSGVLLGAALLVRSQLLEHVLTLLLAVVAGTAWGWMRRAEGRRAVAALLLGLLPACLAWTAIGIAVGGNLGAIEALGNFTFSSRYPYGFWQFLDSDGWMGPYRLGTEPYYEALSEAAQKDATLLVSRPRQTAFTAGYVAARGGESLALVLDNAYRLYSRPANDYKWDYPVPYRLQVALQGLIVVLAVFGAAFAWRERRAVLGAAFVPAALALLHALSYPWPRFNQPTMLILIAFAATAVVHVTRAPRRLLVTSALLLAAAGLVALAREPLLLSPLPSIARACGFVAWMLVLTAAFRVTRRLNGDRATPALIAALVIALPATAHALRDRRWHELSFALSPGTAAEQNLALDAAACLRLRTASEAFVVFDLAPPVRPDGLDVVVNGRPAPPLLPTMARFGESTSAGGRDRRDYPQWWAVALDRETLADGDCTVRVELRPRAGTRVTLKADRFTDRAYEGPSFGEWPHVSTIKLEHDGDPRLPVRRALSSRATESAVFESGRRGVVPYRHRIRVITLERNSGHLTWRTPVVPAAPSTVTTFAAYSGERGEAELWINGTRGPSFPLGATQDFEIRAGAYALRLQAQPKRGGMAYGVYTLQAPVSTRDRMLELSVRFRSGMSIEPMFFSLDARAEGASAILDVDARSNSYPETTGRWGVAELF